MVKNLYVAATESYTGKSAIILGLMELLTQNIKRVGFFRPMIETDHFNQGRDNTIELVRRQYDLPYLYEEMYAFTSFEASILLSQGQEDELQEGILTAYNALAEKVDFILCDGVTAQGSDASFNFDLNIDIANNLGSPVLLVATGRNTAPDRIRRAIKMFHETLASRGSTLIGTVVNRVPADIIEDVTTTLQQDQEIAEQGLYIIPEMANLGNPSVGEVARLFDAEILYGADKLTRHVRGFTIAAMHLRNFLQRIQYGDLVISAGDRSDIILACLAALDSDTMPNISGIMLTGGLVPDPGTRKVIEGFSNTVPILSVPGNTYQTAIGVDGIHATITPDNSRKINEALAVFERYIDTEELRKKIIKKRATIVTPKMFEAHLLQWARKDKRHIVLPEGEDERILKAAEILLRRQVVDLTLLGDRQRIEERIKSLGLHISGIEIIEPRQSEHFDEYVATYHDLRKEKGLSPEFAHDIICDVNYFATMMVYMGHADGMVSGAQHTTADTIRPAFKVIKTAPDFSVVSSVFLICLNDRVLVYGDCAVVPNPTAEELAEIALSSAQTARLFNIEPRVAMLSYSSGVSGSGEQVDKIKKATAIARKRAETVWPGLPIEGPIQYDAAVDPTVAAAKMPDSEVAGRATVFIFPDLNTGNNTYKAVQRSTGAVAIGPIMQGLRRPVNDLSRGCKVADIVTTVAFTAIQAQGVRRESGKI